jgi:hypothetical protein
MEEKKNEKIITYLLENFKEKISKLLKEPGPD